MSTPAPIDIVVVDLEAGPPELSSAEGYTTAWVVGQRDGIPQGIAEVALGPGAPSVSEQLEALAGLPRVARVGGTADPAEDALPYISVVVPSIVARVEDLGLCLDGFRRLSYPRFEVIVVDNRRVVPDPDPLVGLVADRDDVRVVREPHPGISAARNAGVAAARGDVVVFTDDDVQVDRLWLAAIGRRFALEPSLDAVTGLILPAELETPAQIWFERYYGGFSGERTFAPLRLEGEPGRWRPVRRSRVSVRDTDGTKLRSFAVYGVGAYGAGANMAFRRSVLVEQGGFDLALGTGTPARGGEDLATLINVLWNGGAVGFEPAAVVFHKHRREYPELLHQLDGNGLGFVAMLTSLVTHDPRHLLGLASQLPLAVRRMGTQSLARLKGIKPGDQADAKAPAAPAYPSELVRHELRGMLKGVTAYARSRRTAPRQP